MSKIPTGGTPRELPEEGTHNAVLVEILDFGTQPGSEAYPEPKRKCQLAFECVDLKTKEGKAIVATKQYTFSNSPKSNLMGDLKSWLGVKDGNYDMDNALAKGALITIEHSTTQKGTYANITNITAPPKGMKIKKHSEPLVSLYLDETFDKDTFDSLAEWKQTKIAGSPEYAAIMEPRLKKKPAPAKAAPTKAAAPAKKKGK